MVPSGPGMPYGRREATGTLVHMADPDRFAGARIMPSPDPGDDGRSDPAVAAALAEYSADREAHPAALAAVQEARLLVPVVALAGEVEHDEHGLAHDKSSDMAAVLMQGRDGRLALLAFTGTESLQAWNPDARPVPVPASVAAQSALQDDTAALVVDVAGPVPFVVEGEDLLGVASGWRLAELDGRSVWVRPEA
jgi:hypothetical protein